MKNYNKLSLITLLVIANNFIKPARFEEHERKIIPDNKTAHELENYLERIRSERSDQARLDQERRSERQAVAEYTTRTTSPEGLTAHNETRQPVSRPSQEIENADIFYKLMEIDIKRAGGKISPEQEREITSQLEKISPEALRYIQTHATTSIMKNLASKVLQEKEIENAKNFYTFMEFGIEKVGGKISIQDQQEITSMLEKFSPESLRYIQTHAKTQIMKNLASEVLQRKEPSSWRGWWNTVSNAFSRK
jgi:hypothetical protein